MIHARPASIRPDGRVDASHVSPTGLLRWFIVLGWVAAIGGETGMTADAPEPSGFEMRVESTVHHDGDQQPVGRSLALFHEGIVWDFLQTPTSAGKMQLSEIVLHDPPRERIVMVDPQRGVKVEIDRLRLERLNVSLASWSRQASDRVIRWAGSADFGESLSEEGHSISLKGPQVRYAVTYEAVFSSEAADAYRQFADSALLLRALMDPGGLPPFPRMAINRRVAIAKGIPTSVVLELGKSLPGFPGQAVISTRDSLLRSEHSAYPRLLAEDHRQIADAGARIAMAEVVTVAEYAGDETLLQGGE